MITEVGCMGVKPNMNIMDPSTPEGQILTEVWKTVLSKPGGPQTVYWGLESVDSSKVWCFFDFDSVEQHHQFAEKYGAEAVKDIPKICTHGEFSKHIKMVPSSDVLQSPSTEVMLAYFPQNISKERQEALSLQMEEILGQSFKIFPDVAKISRGWGIENDFPARSENCQPRSVLMSFIGWSSADAWAKYRETNGYKDAVSEIEGLNGCTSLYRFTLTCQHLERMRD